MPERIQNRMAGDASEVILAPDALTQDIYQSLAARRYAAAGLPSITVVAAYGAAQNYASQLHRPEVCYPASGFQIENEIAAPVTIGGRVLPARLLLARRHRRSDAVFYWARIAASYPSSLWSQRLDIVRAALSSGSADGVLVRVSLASIDTNSDRKLLEDFVQALWTTSSSAARALLFGPLTAPSEEV